MSSPTVNIQRKTERSHEENQERAYIAASRRSDRSIEARVQSARMASEIHKKRTGKSFKITEEIVLKEEMYEEEDDDLPRSYRLLSSQMETPSRNTNDRLEAFLNNKLAMSTLLAQTNDEWRQNEINQLFAQSFPSVDAHSQQQAPQHSNGNMHAFPAHQNMQQQHFQQQQYHDFHNQQRQQRVQSMSAASTAPMSNQVSIPPRHNSETPVPPFGQHFGQHMQSISPPSVGSSSSAFTPEMSPEAKALMGHPEGTATFDPLMQEWMHGGAEHFDGSNIPRDIKVEDHQDFSAPMDMMDVPSQKWAFSDTIPMDDMTWNTYINDGAWLEQEPMR